MEASLTAKKGSLDRAARYLKRARDEANLAMDQAGADGADATHQLTELAAKAQVLKEQINNTDTLLSEFEQLAAELSDTNFAENQTGWGDLIFDSQTLLALVNQVLGPNTRGAGSGGAQVATASSDATVASAQGGESLTDQFSRLLTVLERQQGHPLPTANGTQSPYADQYQNSSNGGNAQFSRLPKLELRKFGGDILKWKPFWDSFETSVHKNPKLAPVDKLNYLISMLEADSEPLMLVEHLPLTNENYDTARTLLMSKYGDQRMIMVLMYKKLNDMKPVKNEMCSLRRFVAEIDCLLGSLGSMGQDTSDDHFATIILSKLPPQVVVMLEIMKEVNDPWTVALVREKLSDYLVRLERAAKVSAVSKGSQPNSQGFTAADFFFAGSSGAHGGKPKGKGSKPGTQPKSPNKEPVCTYCGSNHFPDKCNKYPTADERVAQLKRDTCRVCLASGHQKRECRSRKPCFYCKMVGNHHSSLCFKQFGKNSSGQANLGVGDAAQGDLGKGNSTNGGAQGDGASTLLALGESVTLQTAQIPVKATNNTQPLVITRGLFDPGADRSYCSEALANRLGSKLVNGPLLKVNRFGSNSPVVVPTKTTKLQLKKHDGTLTTLEVSVVPRITGQITRSPVSSANLQRLVSRLHLADKLPLKAETGTVELLIGNDYYLDLITGEKIQVEEGLYLLGSEFGYILSGRSSNNSRGVHGLSMCGFTTGTVNSFDMVVMPKAAGSMLKKPEMSDYWSLETIGILDDPDVKSDEIAAQNFDVNVSLDNGRYSVGLPWNDDKSELQSNFKLSEGRLNSLVKRLQHHDELYEKYSAIIKDQEEKNVIEKVDDNERVPQSHYIPHHTVVTPQKETTKVRVVYDGSAKTRKDKPSLNDCLHRGPILLKDLVGLLLRFRTHKIALIADIEKAFLQIGIKQEDRDMLRFLWLKDPQKRDTKDNVQIYRFCRVLFGLNCSPALLAQTIHYHLTKSGTPVANRILGDLYVDNVITGVSTVDEAEKFYSEAKDLFNQASMNLREWASNSREVDEKIPTVDRMKATKTVKVLGLNWNRAEDTIAVCVGSKLDTPASTKREFLSKLSSVFDPLGLFAPVTVSGKVLLQSACESKPDWDSKLPNAAVKDWETRATELQEIPHVAVARHIPTGGECMLVAFSDASMTSFATAIYLWNDSNGCISSHLLMAKNRLNPTKKLTIPRLELMGILIGVRALNFVTREMKLARQGAVLYSDSSCALSWLQSQKKQDLFVKNRVQEIAKSNWISFRHVSTDQNPADWATRGKRATEIDNFWWNGPSWLAEPKEYWPSSNVWQFGLINEDSTTSTAPLHQMTLSAASDTQPVFGISIERYSSCLKLIRVTAWCSRFLGRLQKKDGYDKCLNAEELCAAKEMWEVCIQSEAYGPPDGELRQRAIRDMSKMNLFQDEKGLIRCHGRLAKSDMPWETKFPKLMPKSHHYTRLLVDHIHRSNGHASVPHTLSLLRREYWIPKGRQLVKSVVHKCVVCRKASGRSFSLPKMPGLPTDRVVPLPTFSSTGVDYFGPVKVKGFAPAVLEKAWVALFTCLTTRAIHMELVKNLSADEFLMALRRFIARRGKPTFMLSDNAPQFKAVAKAMELGLEQVFKSPCVLDFCAREGITWRFIVEYAPYMGGVYERLVGLVKVCLRKTVGAAYLTPRQLETLLFECEAIINTRPLTYVGSDLDDGTVLTPAHFLSLNPRVAISELPIKLSKDMDFYRFEGPTMNSLMGNWRKGNNLLNEFWKRWKLEYLASLREQMTFRHKHNQGVVRAPKIGDVVLLVEVALPRGSWKLAKISKVHTGKDRLIRSVTVDLPSGRTLQRPINLVVPLECWDDGTAENEIQAVDRNYGTESGRGSPEL